MLLNTYRGCLFGGLIFALVTMILGDLLGDAFHGLFHSLSFDHLDFLQPMVLVSGITIFGGTGVMLTRYISLDSTSTVVGSLMLAVVLSILIYFAYVKPMKNSENSIGYSMKDLIGLTGEISITVPIKGEMLKSVTGLDFLEFARSLTSKDKAQASSNIKAE